MELLIEIFKQTPWWVFLLFVGLTLIGLRATQQLVITVKKIWLLPLVFTVWNLAWSMNGSKAIIRSLYSG